MPALNFQKQFAADVESGKKCQTIRAYRKNGRDPKPEDRLYLYTGMRTKACRKLREAVCLSVREIFMAKGPYGEMIFRQNRNLGPYERDLLAQADGFVDSKDMLKWFENVHGLPFKGLCIQW